MKSLLWKYYSKVSSRLLEYVYIYLLNKSFIYPQCELLNEIHLGEWLESSGTAAITWTFLEMNLKVGRDYQLSDNWAETYAESHDH